MCLLFLEIEIGKVNSSWVGVFVGSTQKLVILKQKLVVFSGA